MRVLCCRGPLTALAVARSLSVLSGDAIECVPLLYNVFSYHRMCSLGTLIVSIVRQCYRMCSLAVECVLLPQPLYPSLNPLCPSHNPLPYTPLTPPLSLLQTPSPISLSQPPSHKAAPPPPHTHTHRYTQKHKYTHTHT